jgi:hypothetical protein
MLSKEEYKERLKVLFSEMLDELPETFYELSKKAFSMNIDLTLFIDKPSYGIEETWFAEVLEMPDAFINEYSRERKIFNESCDLLESIEIDFDKENDFSEMNTLNDFLKDSID